MSSSSKPSQYPLLGFKDRHLEDDYLEYLVVASRARIILGYVTVILLYGLGPFALYWPYYKESIWLQDLYRTLSDEQKEDFRERLPEGTGSNTFQRLRAPHMPLCVSCFSCSFLVGLSRTCIGLNRFLLTDSFTLVPGLLTSLQVLWQWCACTR